MGRGFFEPKKTDGLAAREMERPLKAGCGLAAAPGVKELAAGLGLNSIALTLNLVDPGVLFGLLTPDRSPAGPEGGRRAS